MSAEKDKEYVDFAITARQYKTLLTKKYAQRKFWENPNPLDVHSSIPGTVVDIFVKEGDRVEEGQPVLVLEAMKMKNLIEMPFSAKIKTIKVEKGSKIPKDTLLFELER